MTGLAQRVAVTVVGVVLLVLVALGALIVRSGGGAVGAVTLPIAVAPTQEVVVPAPSTAQQVSRSGSRLMVSPVWAARTAAAAGIPVPAMQAYGDAQLRLQAESPNCHLAWNTLAGIGWVESQNGTIGGRTLLGDGRSSTPVIGPALDGTRFAAIRSTAASAAWHGDRVWEHAVGPLQFIASTWQRWGADGDEDGVADPLDIDDAALTAARYLCADGHDLATAEGWSRAIESYNHDRAYVLDVLAAANAYAQRTTAGR